MHFRIFAIVASLTLALSRVFGGEPGDSNERAHFVGTWVAIFGPHKQLRLEADGTASFLPFVKDPDYLLSGTFDYNSGIANLRFVFPYCGGTEPYSAGLVYQCRYEAHLEGDELVVCQTEGFAGDCLEPDFRCQKEPVTDGRP